MHPALRELAEATKGFMPPDEGLALYDAAIAAGDFVPGAPFVEIGSWCGKSTVYLGAAARQRETVLLAIDHHHGSEENQEGWEHHDTALVDPYTGLLDTLPTFRRTIHEAGLEDCVIAVVANSPTFAAYFSTPCAFVFIYCGHGADPAHGDYDSGSHWVAPKGYLAMHAVFPTPPDGVLPPYEVYLRALEDGFTEVSATGSLRVLQRS